MLYDPKWEKQTKVDPLTLPPLIAWLEQQSPSEKYCYYDAGHCLFARYLSAHGFHLAGIGGDYFRLVGADKDKQHPIPDPLSSIAAERPHTFGAALERARKLAV